MCGLCIYPNGRLAQSGILARGGDLNLCGHMVNYTKADLAHDFEERMAICMIDGGLTEQEAWKIANEQRQEELIQQRKVDNDKSTDKRTAGENTRIY